MTAPSPPVEDSRGSWPAYSASLLAGVAAYWFWWYAIPADARSGAVLAASWFAMGFVASLGAGRAALLLGHRRPDAPLSVRGRALGYVGGCGLAIAIPQTWLEVVDLAGLLFILVLALGCLVGVGEIALALVAALPKRRGADGTRQGSGGGRELLVRKATQGDVTAVTALLGRCIEEMRRRGVDQWDDVYPTRERFEMDVSAESLYVAASGATEIIGAFTLDENQDPEYAAVGWSITATRVAVVHRLMVDPSVQGHGIARELMKSAERLAIGLGCTAMRLDAFVQNPQAIGLYKGMAYRDAGEVTFRKGPFRCFEKQLAHATSPTGAR